MAAMMRSLSSCLGSDTDMAQDGARHLGKEALDQIEPGAMGRREGELEAALGLAGEPRLRLLGDVSGMIIEGQLDRGVSRISGIKKLEELDELSAAVAISDEGMDLPGEQINPGQQTGTRPVKAAEMVIDSAASIMMGGGYAAASCRRACFQFQGRSSSIRLAG